ncbi:MAG: hypothetical protein EP339_09970 [Gammaproteobacteria bacterium]|nr:MAG: hypothetical protein EP339_09970 [Gammaproteobacteria bacterium]
MSNRIDLPLSASIPAGLLSIVPWLVLLLFSSVSGAMGHSWLWSGTLVAFIGGLYQFRSTGMLTLASSVIAVRQDQGRLSVLLADGREIGVRATGSSRIGSRLTLLKLRPVDTRLGSYSSILLASTRWWGGNVPNNEFRRLRVWLRLGKSEQDHA